MKIKGLKGLILETAEDLKKWCHQFLPVVNGLLILPFCADFDWYSINAVLIFFYKLNFLKSVDSGKRGVIEG